MRAFIALLSLVTGANAMGCSSMGSKPDKNRKEVFTASTNYDSKKEKFINRKQGIIDEMWDRNFSLGSMIDFFKPRKDAQPEEPLPEVKPNVAEFLKQNGELKVIWFGHSSFMLNMDGKIVLVDPVFSGSAAPVSFLVERFQDPALSLEELPEIDYVLISHDHYDHLDMESIEFFKDKKTKFITPLGVGSHIEGWGIPRDRIVEKDWWQKAEFDGIRFIATPAQHFSGRGLFDRNDTQWASWVLQSKNHNVYFSGDTGYDTHFKAIGDKYGPFDVAFIESGQYNQKWREVHMLPEEGVQAYRDLKAKRYFPVHWGMFVLALHTWYDPMEQLFKLSKKNNVNLVTPKLGQIVDFSDHQANEFWWKKQERSVTATPISRSLVCSKN